jgi:hypothetical protein
LSFVSNWREVRVNPALAPSQAKSRQALVDEITEDLVRHGGGTYGKMSARIAYTLDWRGTFGYLVPAVQIHLSSAPDGLTDQQLVEFSQSGNSRAGVMRSYELIDLPDEVTAAP